MANTEKLLFLILNCICLISAQTYFYPNFNLNPAQFVGEEEIIPESISNDDLLQPIPANLLRQPLKPQVPQFQYQYQLPPLPYPNLNFPETNVDYFEDFDINGKLISNTTYGFPPLPSPVNNPVYPIGWPYNNFPKRQYHKIVPQVTSRNNSYSSPIESVHRHDFQMKNQTTTIVAHTIIRPKQKPKTIIEIFKDPSQNGENVTLIDPENSIFEFNTSLVNVYPSSTEQITSRGLFDLFGPTSTPSTDTDINLDESYIRTNAEETSSSTESPRSTTEATASTEVQDSDDNNQSSDNTNNDSGSQAEDEYDENQIVLPKNPKTSNEDDDDEKNEDADYDENVQQDQKFQTINNKTYVKVPIWLRKTNTTPKMLAFNAEQLKTTTSTANMDINNFLWYKPSPRSEDVRTFIPAKRAANA